MSDPKPSRLSDLPGVTEEDAAALTASDEHYTTGPAPVYVISVPRMPPGYRLSVSNGNGWQSFGWVHEHSSGTVLAVRNGIGDAERAVASAWQHSRSETK